MAPAEAPSLRHFLTDLRDGLGYFLLQLMVRHILEGFTELVEDREIPLSLALQAIESIEILSRNDGCHWKAVYLDDNAGLPVEDLVEDFTPLLPGSRCF